jgi:hypothetical protein
MHIQFLMVLDGEDFAVQRAGRAVGVVKGLYRQRRRCVRFLPYTDIREGDVLVRRLTHEELLVTAIDLLSLRGLPYERQASFASAKARWRPPAANTRTAPFDWWSIHQEIDRRGGVDRAELRELTSEVQALLERQGELPQGFLAPFSGLLRRHGWVTEPIVKAMLAWATG